MRNNTNPQPLIARMQVAAMACIATLVLGACAQTSGVGYEAPPPAPSGGAGSSGDGQLEEIIVTGTSAERGATPESQRDRRQRQNSAGDANASSAPLIMGFRGPQRREAPVLAHVSPDEEVWIITKPAADVRESDVDDAPGSGALVTTLQSGQVPLPLKHTAVRATIDGYISTVNVTQQFENPYSEKIEAVYMFPLPEKSAVSEFVMTIGERKIRGILREKEEAAAIYQQARAQGYQASLLVQHRPNVFEQKVANIEPGKAIDIDIRYFHSLAYRDGWYSFVFPTVVGPRFNPPGTKNPIAAVGRGTQTKEELAAVTYLRPAERSAHDISVHVEINAGVKIEDIRSSHPIVANKADESRIAVKLAGEDTIPNRDFILDFKVAGEQIRSNLLTYRKAGDEEGYFSMMLYPPSDLASLPRQPMELVFVIDSSGSMNGRPIEQAKAAVSSALSHLGEEDSFQIIRFSDNSSQFGNAPVPATDANIAAARKYLRNLHGTGGTMMIEGVKAALDFPHDPKRYRVVSFLTDGYIGNESDIIAAVHDRIGASRIFSFGVGSSVNRFLLERMAKEGRGAVAFLGPNDSGAEIMSLFFDRASRAALTDLQINWQGMNVSDVYPARIPDLFVGRPVFITGKYRGNPDSVVVSGLANNTTQQFVISGAQDVSASSDLSKIWARLRVADLADRQAWEADPYGELAAAIKSTALEHQIMSDYTSFIAVDASRQTSGSYGTTVQQAVPVPDGVRYDTTVDGKN